jgi:hypothetical protein
VGSLINAKAMPSIGSVSVSFTAHPVSTAHKPLTMNTPQNRNMIDPIVPFSSLTRVREIRVPLQALEPRRGAFLQAGQRFFFETARPARRRRSFHAAGGG